MSEAKRVACVAGASGLVGRELTQLLLSDARYERVHSLVRRATGVTSAKLSELVVSFDALPELPRCDDAYVALGTTIKQAGSEEAFRRVDYEYVLNVARAALAAGATRLGIVSAMSANASSRVFYSRVKGEMEQQVISLGYKSVVIAQPGLLMGDRDALGQPKRAGEAVAQRVLGPLSVLIPAKFRPVLARDVAASLITGVTSAERGTVIVPSRAMHGAASS